MIKGIRGATTIEENTPNAIKEATLELLNTMIKKNSIEKEQISHVIFTLTKDLNAEFPAKYARLDLGWNDVAMMCFNELEVENSLQKCLRILIVINCEKSFLPEFVYLKETSNLRK